VTGSIRSTSNSFTTRLALVFASWTDENIIRIETVQGAFVASSRRIFFLFDFENISQRLLKAPKAPRSTFRYVWGIHGNRSILDLSRYFPSMYKGTFARQKASKIFSNAAERSPETGLLLTAEETQGP
jgi:hypothetical protein